MSRDGLSFLDRRQSAGPGKTSFHYQARHARTQGQRPGAVDSHGAWAVEPLTEREIKVLQLLRGSLPLREIAVELRLSRNTVKSHTLAIYRKLGVSTRQDAISRESPPQLRPGGPASIPEPLTEREIEVLELLRGSLLLREIAVKLRLSPNTVKSHTRAIYRKLGVSTRHEAITWGQGADILPPGTGRHERHRVRREADYRRGPGMTAEPAGSVRLHSWDGAGAPGGASPRPEPGAGSAGPAQRSGAA